MEPLDTLQTYKHCIVVIQETEKHNWPHKIPSEHKGHLDSHILHTSPQHSQNDMHCPGLLCTPTGMIRCSWNACRLSAMPDISFIMGCKACLDVISIRSSVLALNDRRDIAMAASASPNTLHLQKRHGNDECSSSCAQRDMKTSWKTTGLIQCMCNANSIATCAKLK